MNDRWQQVERIYHAARELTGAPRAEFLAQACAGDEALRREVESLLAHEGQAGSFLESPPIEMVASAFGKDERSSNSPDATLETGTMVAHYRLGGKIGEGGMGEVYRARDTKLQRDVALKILPQAMAHDSKRMARFEREAQVLASLNHPNIAAIHGLEDSNGIRALVMELVKGETLAEQLGLTHPSRSEPSPQGRGWSRGSGPGEGSRSPSLAVDDALPIARQIAEALEYAHERGVIHRDLKPANVKITPEGTVKVLDFGLAKVLGPQDSSYAIDSSKSPTLSAMATQPGMILGTASYMSPEQAKGLRVDRRCDIWAFGCVLYEMLSGRKAFDGETISDVLAAVIMKDPDWTAIPETTPPSIKRLVRRCLQKDQRQRLQAIGEARIAIEETLSGEADVAAGLSRESEDGVPAPPLQSSASGVQHPTSDIQIIADLARRHKKGLFAALTAAVILAAAVVWIFVFYRKPSETFQVGKIERLTNFGDVDTAAISPDGRYVAYVRGVPGEQSIWLHQTATGSDAQILSAAPTSLPGAGPVTSGLTFTSDGNFLYFLSSAVGAYTSGDVFRTPSLGGHPKKIANDAWVGRIAISPDGKLIAFVRMNWANFDTSLIVANADGSKQHSIASDKGFKEIFHPYPAWSPDGKVIAVPAESVVGKRSSSVIAVDVSGGGQRVVMSTTELFLYSFCWLPDGSGLIVAAANRNQVTQQQLWRVSYPSGVMHRVTHDLNNYSTPTITANGKALSVVQSQIDSNLWIAPKGDTGQLKQITSNAQGTEGTLILNWPPGDKIFYSSMDSGTIAAWSVNTDGSNSQNVTNPPEGAMNVEFSACPKGPYLVFNSRSLGSFNLWRINRDGTGPTQLTDGGFDIQPSCSPDGKWVTFVRFSHGGSELMRTPIEGGQARKISNQSANCPTISPDGKWIASITAGGGQPKLAIIPFAGGAPVKTFPLPQGTVAAGMGVHIHWTPDSRAVGYIRTVKGATNIWEQSLAGGPPKQVTHFTSGQIFNFAWSPRGDLALARGSQSSDVVLIRNLQ